MKKIAELAIIIPCFNEEEILPKSIKTLDSLRANLIKDGLISDKSKLIFVNDGSTDKTWQIIEKAHAKDNHIQGIIGEYIASIFAEVKNRPIYIIDKILE